VFRIASTRIDMTDDQERQVAAEIEQSHPNWAVMWGCYSRRFWAFPYFQASPGTLVSAPDRDRLLADMHSIEHAVSISRADDQRLLSGYAKVPVRQMVPVRAQHGG
jgi:hypothetical protein